jgi:hypothetical protein
LNERFVVMSHARGLVTAPVIPRYCAEPSNSSAAPAYIRPSAIVPALNFEQGVTESRFAESRELASQTLRPHSASNGRRYACPVDSPRWRKAEILPPSGCPPSTLPTRGEPRPLHFPKWRRGAGLDPQCWRTQPFSKRRRRPRRLPLHATTIGVEPTCLRFRKPLLVQLSYVVMIGGRRNSRRIYFSSSTSQ